MCPHGISSNSLWFSSSRPITAHKLVQIHTHTTHPNTATYRLVVVRATHRDGGPTADKCARRDLNNHENITNETQASPWHEDNKDVKKHTQTSRKERKKAPTQTQKKKKKEKKKEKRKMFCRYDSNGFRKRGNNLPPGWREINQLLHTGGSLSDASLQRQSRQRIPSMATQRARKQP